MKRLQIQGWKPTDAAADDDELVHDDGNAAAEISPPYNIKASTFKTPSPSIIADLPLGSLKTLQISTGCSLQNGVWPYSAPI